MKAKTNTKRSRQKSIKTIIFAAAAILLAVAGINIGQNLRASASGDMPSWGNDGLGIIFTDNYAKDENGVISKQLAAADVGDTVNYSIKLNAKKFIDGDIVVAYGVSILENDWYNTISEHLSELSAKVNGETVSSEDLKITQFSTEAGDWNATSIPWADVQYNGECANIYTNIRPEDGESEILFNEEDCENGALWRGDGTIKSITSIRDDAEIEISLGFTLTEELRKYAIDHDADLVVKHFYSYYDAAAAQLVHVVDSELAQPVNELAPASGRLREMQDTTQAASLSGWGNLLIRRVDADGNPLERSIIEVDGVRADNYGGVYYADQDGKHQQFQTNEHGEVLIKGLNFGEYNVREIKAPEGHNLAAPARETVNLASRSERSYYRERFIVNIPNETTQSADYANMLERLADGRIMTVPNNASVRMVWNEEEQRYEPTYMSTAFVVPSDDGLTANIAGNIINFKYSSDTDEYIPDAESFSSIGNIRLKKTGQDLFLSVAGSTDVIQPTAEEECDDENISFLKNANYYIFNENGQERVFTYDAINDMYIYEPEDSINLGWSVTENDNGTIDFYMDENTGATFEYDEESQSYVGEADGASLSIKKYGDYYIVSIPDFGEYRFDYDQDSDSYEFKPSLGIETLRALSDNSLQYKQLQPLVHLYDNRYALYMLFLFEVPMDRDFVLDSIPSAEVVLMDIRDASNSATPESIPNPQTSDPAPIAVIALTFAITIATIARKKLQARH